MIETSVLEEVKSSFDENGYAKIPKLFSEEEIQDFRQNVARYQSEVAPKIDKYDRMEKHDEPGKFTLMGRMDTHDPYFHRLLNDPRLRETAEQLLGGPVTTQHMQFFNIIPGYGGPTPPHQDAFNFLIDPSHALAFWIPLVKITEENGGLRYVKGSHNKGHRHHDRKFVSTFIVSPFTDEDRELEEPVRLDVGDVATHHCFTIHRSEPNRGQEERWAIAAIYYTQAFSVMKSRDAWLDKYGEGLTVH